VYNFEKIAREHMHSEMMYSPNYKPELSLGYKLWCDAVREAIGDFSFHKLKDAGIPCFKIGVSTRDAMAAGIKHYYPLAYDKYEQDIAAMNTEQLGDFVGCCVLNESFEDYNDYAQRADVWTF
jgi:hypothetical protein